jgi:hypothetical protein
VGAGRAGCDLSTKSKTLFVRMEDDWANLQRYGRNMTQLAKSTRSFVVVKLPFAQLPQGWRHVVKSCTCQKQYSTRQSVMAGQLSELMVASKVRRVGQRTR